MLQDASRVAEMLGLMKGATVLVAGDVILDRFERGEVLRLSREAPVPVLKKTEQHDVPGGAANVAANVVSLGGRARLVGVAGRDEEARLLESLLDSRSVEYRVIGDSGRPTALKTRFTHKSQQFLRLDRETQDPAGEEAASAVMGAFADMLDGCDCVVLSDYALGFFSPALGGHMVREARARGVPVLVDPRPQNGYLCEDCDLFVPSRADGLLLSGMAADGDAPGERVAEALLERFGNSAVVTDGANGMFVAEPGRKIVHISSTAREVFDVSGAGDTVAAALALGLGGGCPLLESAGIANEAAGVVVSKFGTAVAYPGEIVERAGGATKVMDHLRLKAKVEEARLLGRRVVFTNGCFDLLHLGHIRYLKASRELGDMLVVALNSDESVRRLKGPERPLISERQRAELIAALEFVDCVTLFDEDTPIELLSTLRPDVFAKGGDYTEEMLPEAPVVRSYGGVVRIVPIFGDGISTSSIIDRISGRKPEAKE